MTTLSLDIDPRVVAHRPKWKRLWCAGCASAVTGAGVVLAVHYGRSWADGTCSPSGDCLGADASIHRNMLLILWVVTGGFIALFVARVSRFWLIAPIAFAVQGAAMLVVEHADGFWLPLWLDVLVGAVSWSAVAVLLTWPSVSGRQRAGDQGVA